MRDVIYQRPLWYFEHLQLQPEEVWRDRELK